MTMPSYAPLYAPLPDPGAYLARLGIDSKAFLRSAHPDLPESPSAYSMPHTKESLDLLVREHLFHVPFEDLDTYDLKREVSLEIGDLFEKIVVRRRGGYCFELNGLLFALIESLGFDCYPVGMRVAFEGDFPPIAHRATLVTLPGGERVLCDVGFGGPAPITAMYLDMLEPQRSGKLTFRYDRDGPKGLYRQIYLLKDGSELVEFLFSDRPVEQVDFLLCNAFMTHNEGTRFHNSRVLNLLGENGSVAIDNDVLRIHEGGKLTEVPLLTREARKKAYIDYFGMPEDSLTEF